MNGIIEFGIGIGDCNSQLQFACHFPSSKNYYLFE
jgi:hypothetical protein